MELIDITMGNPYVNPHVNRRRTKQPYEILEDPLKDVGRMVDGIGEVKAACPEMAVIGSALSYARQFCGNLAAGAIEAGKYDAAGFGRMAFAYPEFAGELLAGRALDAKKCCIGCGKCSRLMRLGARRAAWVRDPYYTDLYRRLTGQNEDAERKGTLRAGDGRAARHRGWACAKALLAEGYRVMLCGVTAGADAASGIRDALDALGDWTYVPCDVSDAAQREELLEAAKERFGRLDLLVNNAGVAPKVRLDVLETTVESYERLMKTNTESCFFMCQAFAGWMIAEKRKAESENESESGEGGAPGGVGYRPRIVNISSISAYTSSVSRGEYCVSKAGIAMVTQLFADRLSEYGIPVFEIRPGIIATDMTAGVHEKYRRLIEEEGHSADAAVRGARGTLRIRCWRRRPGCWITERGRC